MGLGAEAKNNIHIGGAYGDKVTSGQRFVEQVSSLDLSLRERLTLENDDKTFNAVETLEACKLTGLPMVLDIHHQWVNNEGKSRGSYGRVFWILGKGSWPKPDLLLIIHCRPKFMRPVPKVKKIPGAMRRVF